MKKLFIAIAFVLLFTSPLKAAELLMFSNPNCGYCQNFLKEVEPTYYESPAGEVMPLRIINMDGAVPDWYIKAFKEKRIGWIAGTPTFVVGSFDQDSGIVSGEMFSGAVSEEKFVKTIEKYLALAGTEAKLNP